MCLAENEVELENIVRYILICCLKFQFQKVLK